MNSSEPPEEKFGDPLYFPARIETLTQAIAEICGKLSTIFDFDELIETATRLIQQSLGYDQVVLCLFDSIQQRFALKITANINHGQIIRSYSLENDRSLARRAVRYNRTIRINDLTIEVPNYYQATPIDIRSELHIPLVRGSKMIGVLSLGHMERYAFDEDKVVVALKALTTQVAVLIERARQHRKKHLELSALSGELFPRTSRFPEKNDLQNILPGIQILGGIREVLDRIVNGVVDGLGYTGAMVAVLDEKNQRLPVQAVAFNQHIRWLNLLAKAEEILGIQVIGSSVSLINDLDNLGVQSCLTGEIKITHDLYDLFKPVVNQELSRWMQKLSKVKTCVSLPLLVRDQVVGNLYVGTTKKRVSQKDLEALQFFVTNAAIAVQNAMLFETVSQKLMQHEAELIQLSSIEKMISSSLDLHEVLKRILNGVLELTKAEYGHVVLTGKYASDLGYRVSYPEASDSLEEGRLGITQWIIKNKKPKLIDNIDLVEKGKQDLKKIVQESQGRLSEMKSQLGVPISLEGELIGVINIASRQVSAFNELSLDMLERVAVQAAIAIKNAYQFKVERQMQKQLANVGQVLAMGDMAGNMVHRINNWVGAIRADINYLKRQRAQGKFDPDETTELLKDMLDNAEATLAMAENIRKPFQSLDREPIDVNECIANVLRDKAEELSKVVVLRNFAEDLPPVLATQQLELVFENLVNNALQAMRHQAFETLVGDAAQPVKRASQDVLGLSTRNSKDGQWVEIIVQDSGPGLSDDLNEIDIFKLGVTGREGGLGYGLWWCDTFLKRWGGDIQLAKNTKSGCKFLVKLPSATSDMKVDN